MTTALPAPLYATSSSLHLPLADVSVVIPALNAAAGLAASLEGILRQTVPVREIIVIDSGSTDGTQDIARRFNKVRLIEIAPTEFNHGDTRNLGWREAKGDFVLFTVGDARPVDEIWIAALLAGFTSPDVAAVSGQQVVPHDAKANPIDWHRPISQPRIRVVRFDKPDGFEAASPAARAESCALDDVTAMYRRSALEEIGFRRVVFGEDVLFAYDAYRAGKAIAFNPAARVFHYHVETYQSSLKRTVAVALLRYRLFSHHSAKPGYYGLLVRYAWRLARESGLTWQERLRWLRYNERSLSAVNRGIALVDDAIRAGDRALESVHDQYCGTPPIPLKRSP
jgi:rhamnosyltransferase